MRTLLAAAVSVSLLAGCSVAKPTPDIIERTKEIPCPGIAPKSECPDVASPAAPGDNLLVLLEERDKAHDVCHTGFYQWVDAWERCVETLRNPDADE